LQHVERLGGNLAIVDKRRSSAMNTQQVNLIGGPISGKTCLIFDDMISTGGSIVGAVNVVKTHGAKDVYVGATHPVLCGPAPARLRESPIRELVVTNSLPISAEQRMPNMKVVTVAPLLGEAIRRIHRHESVSYLFD
jgi:ribose-phosphate pyrophosphokinase